MNCDGLEGDELDNFVRGRVLASPIHLIDRNSIPKSQDINKINKEMVKKYCTDKLQSKNPSDSLIRSVSAALCELTKKILHLAENLWLSTIVEEARKAGVSVPGPHKTSVSTSDHLKACLLPQEGKDFDIGNVLKLGQALYTNLQGVLAAKTDEIIKDIIKEFQLVFDKDSPLGNNDDHLHIIARKQALQNVRKNFNKPYQKTTKKFRLYITSNVVEETKIFLGGTGEAGRRGVFTIYNVGNLKQLCESRTDLKAKILQMVEPKNHKIGATMLPRTAEMEVWSSCTNIFS